MMLRERWLIVGILGLTLPLVSTAGSVAAPQQSGQEPVPAKAVADPNAPPPPATTPAPADDDQDLKPEAEDQDPKPAAEPAEPAPAPAPAEVPRPQPAEVAVPATVAEKPDPTPLNPGKPGKYDRETAQLLHLVTELKVEVERAGANTLSLAALQKADEIQRIAKDLKEKMRNQGQAPLSKPSSGGMR